MKPWIPIATYVEIIKQAANNDGRAIVEAREVPLLEIRIDVEYAKKEWAKIEQALDGFDKIEK